MGQFGLLKVDLKRRWMMKTKIEFHWVNQWSFFWTKRPYFHFINIDISFLRIPFQAFFIEFLILGFGFLIQFKEDEK